MGAFVQKTTKHKHEVVASRAGVGGGGGVFPMGRGGELFICMTKKKTSEDSGLHTY